MDVAFFPKAKTVIASSLSRSSPVLSSFCLPPYSRREFLKNGIYLQHSNISSPRGRCKYELQPLSTRFLVSDSAYRRFHATGSKKGTLKLFSSNHTDIVEGLEFSEQGDFKRQMCINGQIEEPVNVSKERILEEGKCDFHSVMGVGAIKQNMKSNANALKCEDTAADKISQESAVEVLSSSSDIVISQTEDVDVFLPSAMIGATIWKEKKMKALLFRFFDTLKKWRVFCFLQEDHSSSYSTSDPESLIVKQTGKMSEFSSDLCHFKEENDPQISNSVEALDTAVTHGKPWLVPWTLETVLQVMLLWIASFWLVGSWIIPFLAHAAGFGKESLTHRGQALYSLLTDLAEGLAGISILLRCLSRFRPLPDGWFRFSLKGNWQLDVGLGCLMFPLVNKLSQLNLDLLPRVSPSSVGASCVEQSIMARDPVAMALYAIIVSVCAPVWEEIIFRGFLLPSLTRYMPLWSAIIVSSVAFAFAHFNVQRLLPLIFLGVVMGYVFARSKNLLASMLLHSLWNGFVFWDLMK